MSATVELRPGEVEVADAAPRRATPGAGVRATSGGAPASAATASTRPGLQPTSAAAASATPAGATGVSAMPAGATGVSATRSGATRTAGASTGHFGPAVRPAVGEEPPARSAGRARALVLLVLFLVGCALAAVGVALAAGALWQEVYAWVQPQVVGDMLTG